MKKYACTKCGSTDVFLKERTDGKTVLICGDCGTWLKWVGKKEKALIERYLEKNNKNTDIEFTGTTLHTESNDEFKGVFQVRIWGYNGNKIGYYEVDKHAIPKILPILEEYKIK